MLNEKIESFLGEFSTMVENMTQAEFDAQVSSHVLLELVAMEIHVMIVSLGVVAGYSEAM